MTVGQIRSETNALASRALWLGEELVRIAQRARELDGLVESLPVAGNDDLASAQLRGEAGTDLLCDALSAPADSVASLLGGSGTRASVEDVRDRLTALSQSSGLYGGRRTCPCDWYGEDFHDRFLSLERLDPTEAASLLGLLAAGAEGQAFDKGDFMRFVAAHNWHDPMMMSLLATEFDELQDAWWNTRRAVAAG